MARRCKNCFWWVAHEGAVPEFKDIGECKALPPFAAGEGANMTFDDDWCGLFRIKEPAEQEGE